jgi:hypothetical protein
MLAADRTLLETHLRQSAIKLREKELNLFTENFSSMATQAAVLAGFTTTCLIELDVPDDADAYAVLFLHASAIISICANISCVSLATITSIWGSGKALRGVDGSMDEAVDGMSKERVIIFRSFAIGLLGNLCSVLATCMILMKGSIRILTCCIVIWTAYIIASNSWRIFLKFSLTDYTKLDDLTHFPTMSDSLASLSNKLRKKTENEVV